MKKLNWSMEFYDPMLVCSLNGHYYCIQNNFSKTVEVGKPMMAIISSKDQKRVEFYGTLYECLDFCEKYDEVPILL